MKNHVSTIEGWETLGVDEAIEAATERHGKDPVTSVAYCAFEASGNDKNPEYRFWFDLFLRLSKRTTSAGLSRKIALKPCGSSLAEAQQCAWRAYKLNKTAYDRDQDQSEAYEEGFDRFCCTPA